MLRQLMPVTTCSGGRVRAKKNGRPKTAARPIKRAARAPRADTRNAPRRVPLTITLDTDNLAFVESCVSFKEFDSVDRLFDAALACYRRYVHALNTYTEDQTHKGYSRPEILASIECETVVTKPLDGA
jgi:hypothetical protein